MRFWLKKEDVHGWYHWFAWYPVCADTGEGGVKVVVWLETVLRREKYLPRSNGLSYSTYTIIK